MTDLHVLPATELCRLLAAGEVSSVELLDHFVARVEELDGPINAVVALDAERPGRRRGRRRPGPGRELGPLHGLPMTIKDAYETEGLVTTSGAPELRDHVPTTDATPVARLKAAGAIVFGKTNLPIYAGDLQSYNEVYGVTSNPWALDRTPGGSSGGAAAALAAGFTGLELGSDIGGSIRNPAHFCGVFGLKPTWGVIPGRGPHPRPARRIVVGRRRRVRTDGPQHGRPGARPRRAGGYRRARQRGVAARPRRPATAASWPGCGWPRGSTTRPARWRRTCGRASTPPPRRWPRRRHGRPWSPDVSLRDLGRSWEDLVLPIMAAGLPAELFTAFAEIEQTPVGARRGRLDARSGP